MKKDAHYFAVLAFARATGFKKETAQTIAFASQFVDDAKINFIELKNENLYNFQHDIINEKQSLYGMSTCHSYFRIKTLNYSSMINNTCAFHFVSGCNGKNFIRKLRCKEESPIIVKIMEEALKENDLVKFGLVLHPYADTFSHQGFSGLLSKVNDVKYVKAHTDVYDVLSDKIASIGKKISPAKFDEIFDKLMPTYGHGQVLEYPDLPYLEWSYRYEFTDEHTLTYKFSKPIDNKKRFVRAFQNIKLFLEKFLARYPEFKENNMNFNNFDLLYNILVQEKSDKNRIINWRKKMIKYNLFKKGDKELYYDKNLWLKIAFKNFDNKKFNNRKIKSIDINTEFSNSNWYKFYKAVIWYKEKFFKYSKEQGLNIYN